MVDSRQLLAFCILLGGSFAVAADPTPGQLAFFESKVRPLLVKHCYECHSKDAKRIGGGLRLDSESTILKGGDSGPAVVAGKPDASLIVQAIRFETNEMPPSGKLSRADIAVLVKWVESGAYWPKSRPTASSNTKDGYKWQEARKHWAFQQIQKSDPPNAQNGDRIRNPIDQFVAAKLRGAGLRQSAPASASIFLRRVFIDLTGLPPTPEELNTWTQKLGGDNGEELGDDAVLALINDLLDRPQYGERWGRHWLDVARYSDIGGWSQDRKSPPMAWRYRDWVISSFNADMPYDEFVRRQIVGDKIAQETTDLYAAVGTGFFALGPTYNSDGGDPESVAQAKSETLDDRVDTFSRAFLGLTVSCARCHDHKFDPIPTQDYYSIAGIFNNTRESEAPLVDDQAVAAYHQARKPISDRHNMIKKTRQNAKKEKRPVSKEENELIKKWEQEIKDLEAKAPPKFAHAHTIIDSGSGDMKVALRGNLLKPGEIAPRRFLRVLSGEEREHFKQGSGRRQLADAVVDRNNPLTARVIVNRIWLNHFGRALVRTPGNFGVLGEQPTHPKLLDWLAATLMDSGWSIKSLHRTIMTSATYRSSSHFNEKAFNIDGDNRLVWRMTPRRVDVETWRDSLLSVTGELDKRLGGASIDNIIGSKRRTLYAKISRNAPLSSDEFLRLFDFPIPRASSAKRTTNVIPQQFLFMMNSSFMLDRAKALSARLQSSHDTDAERIEHAYLLLYGRKPAEKEKETGLAYLGLNPTDNKLWQQYAQVLLSANEFMYLR